MLSVAPDWSGSFSLTYTYAISRHRLIPLSVRFYATFFVQYHWKMLYMILRCERISPNG
jgi:hypothetical protein